MTAPTSSTSRSSTLSTLRRLLLVILLFGLLGTTADLLLISHDEDAWQLIPLVVLGLAILSSATVATTSPAAASVTRWFQASMVLMILSGGLGAVLHYRANMEFKREMDPSLSGFALFSSVVQAQAPPALAPGTMALLGMFGLASVFRRDHDSTSGNH